MTFALKRNCLQICSLGLSALTKRVPCPRRCTVTRVMWLAIGACVIIMLILSYNAYDLLNLTIFQHPPPIPSVTCTSTVTRKITPPMVRDHTSHDGLRIDNRVLLIVETQYSRLGADIARLLQANRIRSHIEPSSKSLPRLTHNDKGKYAVVIFENFNVYLNMDQWNRQLLDKYCIEYNVGLIGFVGSDEDLESSVLENFPVVLQHNMVLHDYHLNAESNIWRIIRADEVYYGSLISEDWVTFVTNHSAYIPLAYSRQHFDKYEDELDRRTNDDDKHVTVLQDTGQYDDIKRVLFGQGLKFWLHRLMLLDILSFLSHGRLSIPLDRFIQIDVDDIFVGSTGMRMKDRDVDAMVTFQDWMQDQIPGFHLNLGFSGKYYESGNDEEDLGDRRLLDMTSLFWWFGHMWSHLQSHIVSNVSVIEHDMLLNKNFAEQHGIRVENNYAIAPHHSGVYPVHEPLYEAWKNIWDIKVTSTEEYPHLRPAFRRRGFIHRGIMVLPRQTCGLFTHTIFLDKYPGGRERLEDSIRGGELFQLFITNPINVFMTHMSNYANDRLALYTFESVVKFVQCWTNLKLRSLPPLDLANLYFRLYPLEEDPVWQNPCEDERHMSIWSVNKTCNQLPRFMVIGPQKTGTTALYTFLAMHPAIISNYKSPDTFEEVQFFNGKNYYKGLNWYMNFFPVPVNASSQFLFEKSAAYFDNDMVPLRASALIPKAKLIALLISPAKRAYSWYQHMRSHKDVTALNNSFYEVITADEFAPKAIRDLRSRCLNPGLYAHHLERWLDYYNARQLLVVDGEELKDNPIQVMTRIQHYLRIEPVVDYNKLIRFDPKKGFFCQVVNSDSTKCLGMSKGRLYPPMDPSTKDFLEKFYLKANIQLSKLLDKLDVQVPQWLQEELRDV